MADSYYKKPDGEVFKFERGRMKESSCDLKYAKCDKNGKEVKKVDSKSKK